MAAVGSYLGGQKFVSKVKPQKKRSGDCFAWDDFDRDGVGFHTEILVLKFLAEAAHNG